MSSLPEFDPTRDIPDYLLLLSEGMPPIALTEPSFVYSLYLSGGSLDGAHCPTQLVSLPHLYKPITVDNGHLTKFSRSAGG